MECWQTIVTIRWIEQGDAHWRQAVSQDFSNRHLYASSLFPGPTSVAADALLFDVTPTSKLHCREKENNFNESEPTNPSLKKTLVRFEVDKHFICLLWLMIIEP
eukprot:m.128315 g.128315  ORF g.128315 m.128315 type:complete len:104 (+) comp15670_c0_seq14:1174-1485(+)